MIDSKKTWFCYLWSCDCEPFVDGNKYVWKKFCCIVWNIQMSCSLKITKSISLNRSYMCFSYLLLKAWNCGPTNWSHWHCSVNQRYLNYFLKFHHQNHVFVSQLYDWKYCYIFFSRHFVLSYTHNRNASPIQTYCA